MLPTVIDLTSSPEPDGHSGLVQDARSALQAFQTSKQKNAPRLDAESGDGYGDAGDTLQSFKPRKEKENANGSSNAAARPFGAFVPLIPAKEQAKKIPIQLDVQVPRAPLGQPGQPKNTNAAPTRYQNILSKPQQSHESRLNEGSLASLLRQETAREALRERLSAQAHRPQQAAANPSPSLPNRNPPQALGKVSIPQKNKGLNRQAPATFRAANAHAAKLQHLNANSRLTEDVVLLKNGRHFTTAASSQPNADTSHPNAESARPLKRRRLASLRDSDSLSNGVGAAALPAPEAQAQTVTPASTSSASANGASQTGSITSANHERTSHQSIARISSAAANPNLSPRQPVTDKGRRMGVNASPNRPLPHRSASVSITPQPVIKDSTAKVQNNYRPRESSTVLDKPVQKARETASKEPNAGDSLQRKPSLAQSQKKPYRISLQNGSPPGKHGGVYTPAEDELLIRLKEVENLPWKDIFTYFPGRTPGSVQVHYCTTLKPRGKPKKPQIAKYKDFQILAEHHRPLSADDDIQPRRQRQRRNIGTAAPDGFVTWDEVKRLRLSDEDETQPAQESKARKKAHDGTPQFGGERAYPRTSQQLLRERELGIGRGQRSCASSTRSLPDELKEHVFDSIGPRNYFQGTSGDAICLAWAPNGRDFAVGSIAITDERSMQYNRPCNLLLGDGERGLQELPEHHILRPNVEANSDNVNGLHSMRASQDPRLFMTVANVQFSPDGSTLYSAGSDCKVRAYSVENAKCIYELQHSNPLDLLSVSNNNVVATACHQSADNSIGIFKKGYCMLTLSPSRLEQQTDRAIYPSALKWGTVARHSNLLLAGFSIDSIDEERNIAGETCLWDINAEARIGIGSVTRNVFDVAWNPVPSSTSTVFAVASARGLERVSKGMRSVVQCFAPKQNKAARVLEWECAAFDINDVVYCQHDTNLIAAGATDGKVYVWDQRFADRSNTPLLTLVHGQTLNVLDHDREREHVDTGVRFVSWGATSSRLYTGSSDGVVKVWNPYRATENTHVKDIATFTSAVMSGAFSPDGRDLLIGEDQGRVNLMSVGHEHKAVRSTQKFELQSAPAPVSEHDHSAATRELIKSGRIMTKKMGDLPKRQAVQGPNYQGPYLKPSTGIMKVAREEYQQTLDSQHAAHSKAAMTLSEDSDDENAARKADRCVQEIQGIIQSMESRLDEAPALEAKAEANQKELRRRKKRHSKIADEPCQLDCNYLPATVDDDGKVPDSRRSELRIPGVLRSGPTTSTHDLTREELIEAGLTHKCMACLRPALKPKRGKQALCANCQDKRNGLTAKCELCSAPVRAPANPQDLKLCERCDFACFRCAKPALVLEDASLVACEHCGLAWMAGVLGYELLRVRDIRKGPTKLKASLRRGQDVDIEDNQLARGELEHYASLWK